jgi:hypothetical protein
MGERSGASERLPRPPFVAPAPEAERATPVSLPAVGHMPLGVEALQTLPPQLLLALQQGAGNALLQRALLQRQDTPVPTPAPAPGVAPPPAPVPDKPKFVFTAVSQPGTRFDSEYVPVGPLPAVGQLNINLWVHITYRDFTRAMMRQPDFRGHRFTREQIADFAWTPAEQEGFETGFISSVQAGWGGKHSLHLDDPAFSEYRANVNVNVISVSDPGIAHMKITAQKVPRGAPRFRSFVSGDTATLDIRDPSEPETHSPFQRRIVRQIGPFAQDSADLAPVLTQVQGVVDQMRPLQSATETDSLLGKNWAVGFLGRSSSPGDERHNRDLGLSRAQAVATEVASRLARPVGSANVSSVGERNASADPGFQRVDVTVLPAVDGVPQRTEMTQNVAAHEAGHMFGLGDEYVDERPPAGSVPKFQGDKPSHHGDVESIVGTDAADELLVQNSGSMMSTGGEVKRGHYVYFVQALNQLTGKTWKVE